MSTEDTQPAVRASTVWRRNGAIWAALLFLLGLSLMLAYVPMGFFTLAAGIVIAFAKAGLVFMLFMELAKSAVAARGLFGRGVSDGAIRVDARGRTFAPRLQLTATSARHLVVAR